MENHNGNNVRGDRYGRDLSASYAQRVDVASNSNYSPSHDKKEDKMSTMQLMVSQGKPNVHVEIIDNAYLYKTDQSVSPISDQNIHSVNI